MVRLALDSHGKALQHASAELRADRNIALAAVAQDGLALQFVAAELHVDREVVWEAARQNRDALQYAAEPLRSEFAAVLGRFFPESR